VKDFAANTKTSMARTNKSECDSGRKCSWAAFVCSAWRVRAAGEEQQVPHRAFRL